MPYRQRGSSRRRSRLGSIINSIKNVVDDKDSTGTTTLTMNIALAKISPSNLNPTEVSIGSIIKAVWVSLDVCGLAATGVLQKTGIYILKNEGANLTPPNPFAVGSSNEKKFIFKQWQFMTMRNQDGNNPNHWEGWIKIPRKFQRMGTDDVLTMAFATDTAAGHISSQYIYKWYT